MWKEYRGSRVVAGKGYSFFGDDIVPIHAEGELGPGFRPGDAEELP